MSSAVVNSLSCKWVPSNSIAKAKGRESRNPAEGKGRLLTFAENISTTQAPRGSGHAITLGFLSTQRGFAPKMSVRRHMFL